VVGAKNLAPADMTAIPGGIPPEVAKIAGTGEVEVADGRI
jgi:hypothetical protein